MTSGLDEAARFDYSTDAIDGAKDNASNREAAVITHLLEVEKEASTLLSEAQNEANKRIAGYKAKAESEFKTAHDALVSEIEESYKKQIDAIQEERGKEIDSYKAGIRSLKQDRNAFNALAASCFGGGCR